MRNGAAALAVSLLLLAGCGTKEPITVGSKTTTEQRVLGEIIAQHLERRLDRPVMRDFGAGRTMLAYQNIMMGVIDLYPEYTGDIVGIILQHTPDRNPAVVFDRARNEIRQTAGMTLLDPLGFESSFAIVTSASIAKERGLTKISDLEHSTEGWVIGVTPAFQERRDGYTALMRAYDIVWKSAPVIVDPDALYGLLADHRVDIIAGRTTDGMLVQGGMKVLEDDREAFPPSQACILVRQPAFDKAEGLRAALEELSGKFTKRGMQQMNFEVDVRQRPIREVASEFLERTGL